MNSEVIQSILAEAFDEGARSPYEMKQYVIGDLTGRLQNDLSANQTVKNLQEIAVILSKTLPQAIRSLVSNYRAWLCGGAVLRAIIDPTNRTTAWKSSDYDIYCTPDEFKKMQIKAADNDKPYPNLANVEGFKTLRTIWKGEEVNFVTSPTYTSPGTILDGFDLTIVRLAYCEHPEPALVTFRQTWVDLCSGQIHVVSSKNRSTKTVNRVKKYIKRGFRDCTGLVENGLLSQVLRNE